MYLLAGTVTFISVFIQITFRTGPFQRILKKPAGRIDRIIAILVFDGFSILGTYMGIPLTSGAIGNVRDLGPIIAGLVSGPLLGLGAGLIGEEYTVTFWAGLLESLGHWQLLSSD